MSHTVTIYAQQMYRQDISLLIKQSSSAHIESLSKRSLGCFGGSDLTTTLFLITLKACFFFFFKSQDPVINFSVLSYLLHAFHLTVSSDESVVTWVAFKLCLCLLFHFHFVCFFFFFFFFETCVHFLFNPLVPVLSWLLWSFLPGGFEAVAPRQWTDW